MLAARNLNRFLGTHYTPDEVAGFDPLLFEVLNALQEGLKPPSKGD